MKWKYNDFLKLTPNIFSFPTMILFSQPYLKNQIILATYIPPTNINSENRVATWISNRIQLDKMLTFSIFMKLVAIVMTLWVKNRQNSNTNEPTTSFLETCRKHGIFQSILRNLIVNSTRVRFTAIKNTMLFTTCAINTRIFHCWKASRVRHLKQAMEKKQLFQ